MAIAFGTFSPAQIAALVPQARADRTVRVPGGDASWAVRFGQARLKGGPRLHVAEQGPAGGPAVIMLHGFTDSWFSFSRVMPLLPREVRVIVPDERGHGRSDRPDRYAIADFAADIVGLMDELNLEGATIVGHSMGSFVARAVAQRAPDRVHGLVLIGSAPVARNTVLLALGREVRDLTDPVSVDFVRAFQESCVAQPVPDDFMRRVITESRLVPAWVWKSALAGLTSYTPAPTPIRARTLILGGDKDAVFSVAEQRALAREIPGASIHITTGVGHTPHWEEPEEFAGRLLAFLTRSEK